ncbi:MAG: response regulator [Deltaproteobacteria bacterium]|nr:response regulator [Deltaproteobacteria bacterium]
MNGQKKKVLVVEDSKGLAFIMQMVLQAGGFDVRTANDGWDGFFTYLAFNPDLVITDIDMPRENGVEMIKRIRVQNPEVRTIYMSGELSWFWPLLEEEKKRCGVSFLKKPFSRIELLRAVAELFNNNKEVSE